MMKKIAQDLLKISSLLDKQGQLTLAYKIDRVAKSIIKSADDSSWEVDSSTNNPNDWKKNTQLGRQLARQMKEEKAKAATDADAFLSNQKTVFVDPLPRAKIKSSLAKAGKIGLALIAAYEAFKALSSSGNDDKLVTELEAIVAMKDRAQARDPETAKKIVNNAIQYARSLRTKLGQPGYVVTKEQQIVLLELERKLKEIAFDAGAT